MKLNPTAAGKKYRKNFSPKRDLSLAVGNRHIEHIVFKRFTQKAIAGLKRPQSDAPGPLQVSILKTIRNQKRPAAKFQKAAEARGQPFPIGGKPADCSPCKVVQEQLPRLKTTVNS